MVLRAVEVAMERGRTIDRLADVLVPDYASCAAVVLLDREGSVADCSVRHGDAAKGALARQWVDVAAAPCGPLHSAIMSGQALTIGDAASASFGADLAPLFHNIGAHSTLCVPFGHRAGGVAVLSEAPNAYGEVEVAVVESVGRVAARMLVDDGAEEQQRDQLLAEVHHDLGTPILALQLSLDLLLALGADPGERKHLDNARRALAHIRELTGELREYAEAAARDPSERSIAGALVSETVSAMAPLAQERQVKLAATLNDSGAAVRMRRQDLLRVLSNLVGNAIRHTRDGGLVIVTTVRSKGDVVFRVQDNGAGIQSKDARRLFDPAWLATSSIRRGRGLGLAIVKRLVERSGGKLGLHSRPNVGSSFWFTLPIAK